MLGPELHPVLLPGTEASGILDALFGDRPFVGRLRVTRPASMDPVPIDALGEPLFPYGFGRTTEGALDR